MSPLSILPGRIRLEASPLSGRERDCRQLERRLAELPGILEVSANHRTGRVLVRFDETAADRLTLNARIENALAAIDDESANAPAEDLPRGIQSHPRDAMPKQIARHMVLDMVAHALLPRPFDLLLPTAVAAFRR